MEKKINLELPEKLRLRIESIVTDDILLEQHSRIIVAVSGGVDSVALLHILCSLEIPLILHAVYVDHGLRPAEIPLEIDAISRMCADLKISFQSIKIEVLEQKKRTGQSLEEAARILRYQALELCRINHSANYIAVGHTADDQIEEFFIRLSRGTGLAGLSGMSFKRDRIIRPLLSCTKLELAEYLDFLNIPSCFDSSNLDRKYLRNNIRLDFLPLLERHLGSAIRKKMLQTMEMLRTEEDFMKSLSEEVFTQYTTPLDKKRQELYGEGLRLKAKEVAQLHPALQRRTVELCFVSMQVTPSYDLITNIVSHIKQGKRIAEIHSGNGVRVMQYQDDVLFCRPLLKNKRSATPNASAILMIIDKPGAFEMPELDRVLVIEKSTRQSPAKISMTGNFYLDADKISFPLVLRSFKPGERFTPFGCKGSKKISRYFNEKKVPARERNGWPVLVHRTVEEEEEVIAVPGLAIDDHFKLTDSTVSILTIKWDALTPSQ